MTAVTYDQGRLTVEARPDEYELLPPLLPDVRPVRGSRCCQMWHVWNHPAGVWPEPGQRCECGAFTWGELESERWATR